MAPGSSIAFGAQFVSRRCRVATAHARKIFTVLQQHAQRVMHGVGIKLHGIERHQRMRPVDRFSHAGRFEKSSLRTRCTNSTTCRDRRSDAPGALRRTISSSRSTSGKSTQ